jgi:hypothetical protein
LSQSFFASLLEAVLGSGLAGLAAGLWPGSVAPVAGGWLVAGLLACWPGCRGSEKSARLREKSEKKSDFYTDTKRVPEAYS